MRDSSLQVPRAQGRRSGTRAFTETSHLFAKRIKWHQYGIKVMLGGSGAQAGSR
jgi:hypothetical protein